MKLSPSDAAALKLDLLAGEDLLRLAGAWLEDGLGGAETARLAGEPNPTNCDAAFPAVLRELGVEPPDQAAAVKTALKRYLRRIVEGEVAPYEGVRAINLELTLAFYPHEDSALCFFPRRAGEAHRHGVLWGLERMYDCYRALRDGAGDPAKAAAMEKLTQQLHREAGKALDRLATLD